MNLNSTLGCAIVFAIAASVCGQDKATTTATTAAVAAPSKPAASAGLANDWLCQQPARAAKEESLLLPTAFDSLCG